MISEAVGIFIAMGCIYESVNCTSGLRLRDQGELKVMADDNGETLNPFLSAQ